MNVSRCAPVMAKPGRVSQVHQHANSHGHFLGRELEREFAAPVIAVAGKGAGRLDRDNMRAHETAALAVRTCFEGMRRFLAE